MPGTGNSGRDGRSVEECGQAYLDAIEEKRRGVVLMHDGGETRAIQDGNRALELAEWLVPRLEGRGYRFARLDASLGDGRGSRFTGGDMRGE